MMLKKYDVRKVLAFSKAKMSSSIHKNSNT